MGNWLNDPIPVKWFAVLIVLYIAISASNYFTENEHIRQMDAFMAAGGRFTQEDGNKLEARVLKLEEARNAN